MFDGCWPIAFGVLFFVKVSFRLLACILLFSLLLNLGVVPSLRFCLFIRCFMLTKSILWCLLIHCFWSSPICEGQLSLDTIFDPDATFDESRSYFIVEICLFLHCFMMAKSLLWWLLTHRFWSPVFCEGQLSLVSMCAPDLNGNESRSYFIVELLSLSTFFQGGKIISLMVTDPSFSEFCLLRSLVFACCHSCSWFHR